MIAGMRSQLNNRGPHAARLTACDLAKPELETHMQTFQELAASRRHWIDEVLIPWCQQASRSELRAAMLDWINVAGHVDPDATLWTWAWARFPALTHEGVIGVDETKEVRVRLKSGEVAVGFPDSRESQNGQLVLLGKTDDDRFEQLGPFPIDDIETVEITDDGRSTDVGNLPPGPVTTLDPYTPDNQRV